MLQREERKEKDGSGVVLTHWLIITQGSPPNEKIRLKVLFNIVLKKKNIVLRRHLFCNVDGFQVGENGTTYCGDFSFPPTPSIQG